MKNEHKLGNWTVLDIETTGIDANYDQIIDIGFLSFEGLELKKKYSSLVRADVPVSKFIEKLTGITQEKVYKAPSWHQVKEDLFEIGNTKILAHNSDFEASFLSKELELGHDILDASEWFTDSLYFLALIFPGSPSLSLEHFIKMYNLRDQEMHRGFEDSIDLLKVILLSCFYVNTQNHFKEFLLYHTNELRSKVFILNFLDLDNKELSYIASQIDFDLEHYFKIFMDSLKEESDEVDLINSSLNNEIQTDFTGANIENIFSNVNRLKELFPNYLVRRPQIEFSKKIGQALKNKIHTYIQAPTGTGKTLGYLLPSALKALEDKEQSILISTGTKTLQDQLYYKDLPILKKFLGKKYNDLKITVLKGSSNHLCEVLFNQLQEDLNNDGGLLNQAKEDFEKEFAKVYFNVVFYLNEQLIYNKKITRENIPYVLKIKNKFLKDIDSSIHVETNACTYGRCPVSKNCSYYQGITLSKESNIIIGNHALTFYWPSGIDRPNSLIVDEAHKIENEATKCFSKSFSFNDYEHIQKYNFQYMGSLIYLLTRFSAPEEFIAGVKKDFEEFHLFIKDNVSSLSELIEIYFKKQNNYSGEYWNEVPMFLKSNLNDNLKSSIFNHILSLKNIFNNFFSSLKKSKDLIEYNNSNDEMITTAQTKFEFYYVLIEKIFGLTDQLLNQSENFSHAIKFHEELKFSFEIDPIDIGTLVYDELLKDKDSVIFTSATLANSLGTKGVQGVEWMFGLDHVPADKRFKKGLFLNPVFNYVEMAKSYLITDSPSIYDEHFCEYVIDSTEKLVEKLNGKTLYLFSSKKRFNKATELLLEKYDNKLNIFIQGMHQNIANEFMNTQNSILIGMDTLGEGIDIPGENLSLVVIDKIPDLRHDLVINKRRDFYQKKFGNEFIDYYLNGRCRVLHQKMGRLLRREDDKGGIIIFDSRVKRWKGRTLLDFKELMLPYNLNIGSTYDCQTGLAEFF